MELTISNVYPWKDSSENTHNHYYKPGDVIRTGPTEWVSNGTGWVSTGKPFNFDKAREDSLRVLIASQKKEIEELKKALEVLIGVRDGESADTAT